MNNNKEFKNNLANVSNLSIQMYKDDFNIYKRASLVCERFLRSASLLQQGKFIGWQIDSRTFMNTVFSSSNVNVSMKDYDWIFYECAVSSPLTSEWLEDLYENNRKVYMLSSEICNGCDDYAYHQRTDYILVDDDDYDDERISRDIIYNMFEMMTEAGAIIRMIAGSTNNKTKGHGMIYISLPDEMSLRMRSMLSIVFPHMITKEVIKQTEQTDKIESISDSCFLENMTRILSALICPKDNRELTDDIQSEDGVKSKEESSTWNDHGINTVGDILELSDDELSHIRNIGKKGVEEIKQKLVDIPNLPETILTQKVNYMSMLDELIGLTDIKEQIRKITAFAKMKQDMSENGKGNIPIAMNMEFVGNPGTAKTTVARILAGIFYDIGLLSSKEMIEVGRADLVAKYVGQTAVKVKEVFQRARGKVLFIDEAYSLVENSKGDFGDEAINTIVQEMENNRERTIVIFAGYPDKMERFFDRNPGLRSRVPFSIKFNDYSVDELIDIVGLEAKKREFSISDDGYKKVRAICSEAAFHSDVGNGRFCRNLIENAILSYASRIYGNENNDAEKNYILIADDFLSPAGLNITKKIPIGFHVDRND